MSPPTSPKPGGGGWVTGRVFFPPAWEGSWGSGQGRGGAGLQLPRPPAQSGPHRRADAKGSASCLCLWRAEGCARHCPPAPHLITRKTRSFPLKPQQTAKQVNRAPELLPAGRGGSRRESQTGHLDVRSFPAVTEGLLCARYWDHDDEWKVLPWRTTPSRGKNRCSQASSEALPGILGDPQAHKNLCWLRRPGLCLRKRPRKCLQHAPVLVRRVKIIQGPETRLPGKPRGRAPDGSHILQRYHAWPLILLAGFFLSPKFSQSAFTMDSTLNPTGQPSPTARPGQWLPKTLTEVEGGQEGLGCWRGLDRRGPCREQFRSASGCR
nr:uncharacterized protein LOC105866664 isoform X2 [Microcebus murinus]